MNWPLRLIAFPIIVIGAVRFDAVETSDDWFMAPT